MEKLQVNEPIRQKENGNKAQQKAEKQRRKWIGKKNLKLNSRNSVTGGEPVSTGPGPLKL